MFVTMAQLAGKSRFLPDHVHYCVNYRLRCRQHAIRRGIALPRQRKRIIPVMVRSHQDHQIRRLDGRGSLLPDLCIHRSAARVVNVRAQHAKPPV